jgi:hypothetical protein
MAYVLFETEVGEIPCGSHAVVVDIQKGADRPKVRAVEGTVVVPETPVAIRFAVPLHIEVVEACSLLFHVSLGTEMAPIQFTGHVEQQPLRAG